MRLIQSKDIYQHTWIFLNSQLKKTKTPCLAKKVYSVIKLLCFVVMICKTSVLNLQASYFKKTVFGCTISSNRGVNLRMIH